jgi:hypothetical protein
MGAHNSPMPAGQGITTEAAKFVPDALVETSWVLGEMNRLGGLRLARRESSIDTMLVSSRYNVSRDQCRGGAPSKVGP